MVSKSKTPPEIEVLYKFKYQKRHESTDEEFLDKPISTQQLLGIVHSNHNLPSTEQELLETIEMRHNTLPSIHITIYVRIKEYVVQDEEQQQPHTLTNKNSGIWNILMKAAP